MSSFAHPMLCVSPQGYQMHILVIRQGGGRSMQLCTSDALCNTTRVPNARPSIRRGGVRCVQLCTSENWSNTTGVSNARPCDQAGKGMSCLACRKPGPYIDRITAVDAITQCPQRSQGLQERLPAPMHTPCTLTTLEAPEFVVPLQTLQLTRHFVKCDGGEQVYRGSCGACHLFCLRLAIWDASHGLPAARAPKATFWLMCAL